MSWVCNVQQLPLTLACGAVSDARGFVGWSRKEQVAEAGGSARGFQTGKTSLWESSAHMLWLTLRQEIRWCDDFMAWCLSSGDLICGIASGQRRIKWFVFLLISSFCCFPSSLDTGTLQ